MIAPTFALGHGDKDAIELAIPKKTSSFGFF
jgi:hypothetical protein